MMIRLVYLTDMSYWPEAQSAGFVGYIHGGRAVFPLAVFSYLEAGENEISKEVYDEWRATHPATERFAAYAELAIAKKKRKWHTDHGVIGYYYYPYVADRGWWYRHVGFVWDLIRLRFALRSSQAKVVPIIQAFGFGGWTWPGCKGIRRQEWWWRTIFGGRLYAFAWFIWGGGEFEGVLDHPECWPVNL